jgi:hypothetical protein
VESLYKVRQRLSGSWIILLGDPPELGLQALSITVKHDRILYGPRPGNIAWDCASQSDPLCQVSEESLSTNASSLVLRIFVYVLCFWLLHSQIVSRLDSQIEHRFPGRSLAEHCSLDRSQLGTLFLIDTQSIIIQHNHHHHDHTNPSHFLETQHLLLRRRGNMLRRYLVWTIHVRQDRPPPYKLPPQS